jgi:hypothetical protein
LQTELGLPLSALIVNQVVPELFTPAEADVLAALEERPGPDAAELALAAGIRRAAREKVQRDSLQRLRALPAPQLLLPYLPEGATSAAALARLAAAL